MTTRRLLTFSFLVLLCTFAACEDRRADKAYLRGDYDKAVVDVQYLAQSGEPRAQYDLGLMYDKGQGVPQSDAEALQWYERAAEQGEPRAQYNLGLMYGFPSETVQETIDSLERVRQLFSADLVQSAFWHRFTATAHSPIGLDPNASGLRILGPDFQGFAENDLIHLDRKGRTPEWLGEGLRRSMLNFIEGRGLSMDVREWFDHHTPLPRVSSQWTNRALQKRRSDDATAAERHCVWIGGPPDVQTQGRRARLHVSGGEKDTAVTLPSAHAMWLSGLLQEGRLRSEREGTYPSWREVRRAFPGSTAEFTSFVKQPSWKRIRAAGLLLV